MKHPKNRKMPMLCLALVLVVCVLTACVSSTADVIKVGEDEIPSLYSAVGEKKIVGTKAGTENGTKYAVVTYESGAVSQEEMQQYISALEARGYAQISDIIADGTVQTLQMATESVQDGKVVVVEILFDSAGNTELMYAIAAGTLDRE
ncbi:hypothetical protein LJC56_04485 [Christensenellaceae bacterium OttesenSCG-928-K19]|nr:hypothetical protein [Christensenellaceae bacterium OttesenSCG-928-K19]